MNNTLLYIGIGISLISVIIFFLKDKLGDKTRLYLSGSLGIIAVGLIIASLLVTPPQTVSNYHHNKKNMRIHRRLVREGINVGDEDTPVYVIENFLSPAECSEIIKSAQGKMSPSTLTHYNGDKDFRTSETCYFDKNNSKHNMIEDKICKFMGLSLNTCEPCQIQHYMIGNQFKAHHDYFHPNTEEFEQFAGDNANYQGQRTWTFTVYLNDVDKGGDTEFVTLGKPVHPVAGRAVVWYNLKEDGSPNERTMHRGTPVEKGEKYIITKWFRDRVQK